MVARLSGTLVSGTPSGIRTRDLHLERVTSWAARLWGPTINLRVNLPDCQILLLGELHPGPVVCA